MNRFETALIADSVMMLRFAVHLNSFSAYMCNILYCWLVEREAVAWHIGSTSHSAATSLNLDAPIFFCRIFEPYQSRKP